MWINERYSDTVPALPEKRKSGYIDKNCPELVS
jgi:hypothetical protein